MLNRVAVLRSYLLDLQVTLAQKPGDMRPVFQDGQQVEFKTNEYGVVRHGVVEDTAETRQRWAGDVVVQSLGLRYFFLRKEAHQFIKHSKPADKITVA